MNLKLCSTRSVAALAAMAFVAAACGDTGPTSRGSLTIAGLNSPKSTILADIYGQALAHDGYSITYRLLAGSRDAVVPALEAGLVDLYPGLAATDLEFYNKSAGEANGYAGSTTAKLISHLQPLGLTALTPSMAADEYAFAVTKATQTKYNLTRLEDLAAIAGQLTLGAGPDCATAAFCAPGLSKTYGINFRSVRALDTDGPLTRAAFADGSIDVGLVLSGDGDLDSLGLVVLQDDLHLEKADNVVPILRQAAANPEVTRVLNAIDAKLSTADLTTMNNQISTLKQDAAAVATAWLQQHHYWS